MDTIVDVFDNDSDDYLDDEDRHMDTEEDESEEDYNIEVNINSTRYKIQHWPYHLLKAEDLWPEEDRLAYDKWAELLAQLDRFSTNIPVFHSWQTKYHATEPFEAEYLKIPRKALHVAAYLGLKSWAKHLLDRNEDPNERSGPYTALQAAAAKANCLVMLKLLLERNGDINFESEKSLPAFYSWLQYDSSIESIRLMFDHGTNPLLHDRRNDWTALHYFAWSGEDSETLGFLLNYDAVGSRPDINARGRDGELLYMSCFGNGGTHEAIESISRPWCKYQRRQWGF